jgi:alpha-1,6-mannosyltransferase
MRGWEGSGRPRSRRIPWPGGSSAPGNGSAPAGRPLSRRQRWALGVVAGLLALCYGGNFTIIRLATGAEGSRLFEVYPAFFALVFLIYLAGVRLAWEGGRRVALAAVLLGMLFRLFMLPTDLVLSTDPYRYLWDGRVQLAGINPYRFSPDAPELAGLRDPRIHPRINRPWAPTIYPPGAEAVFAALGLIAPDRMWALRVLLIACEVATLLALLTLQRRLGLPEGRIVVYAWAPLAIFEFAQAGHLDAAMIPLVLGALLAAGSGRPSVAGGLLGAATLIKLYPAILLPVLRRRGDWRLPLTFLATVTFGYLPYAWGVGEKVLGFLPAYFARSEEFNIGLRSLLTDGIGLRGTPARLVVSGLLAILLAGVLVAIGRWRGETLRHLTAACGMAIGAYLLLVPSTIHPWYVVWLIPFLVVLTGPGWWYLTAGMALSYVAYTGGPVWVPGWARAVEYLPAFAGVLFGFLPGWRSARAAWGPSRPGVVP